MVDNELSSLIGLNINRLTVVDIDLKRNDNQIKLKDKGEISRIRRYLLCKCECGNIISIEVNRFKSGRTVSCGCYAKEVNKIKLSRQNKKENTYSEMSNGMLKVYDTKLENFFTIDKFVFDELNKYCWSIDSNGYWRATKTGCRKNIRLHREIASIFIEGFDESLFVDHIDRNKNNNTLSNLRIVSKRENNINLSISKNNTSGKTGVTWQRNCNKWKAQICVNYKNIVIGMFEDIDDAISARIEAENLYGYTTE